ncbi:MAG: hypothetical protein PVF45_07350 [Anaerolineae bacterium]
MTKTIRHADIKTTAPPLHMPDATSTAEDVLNKALGFCASKMRLKDPQMVVNRLRQKDNRACEYCHYSIAEQVGAALGALDENVKAVYMFEYEATPQDLCFSETTNTPLVHLLVWTHRKTKALNALVSMLDRALAQSYARLIGPRQLQYLLDVQIVDDAEVERRIGYGALLHSLHYRPLKVWEH